MDFTQASETRGTPGFNAIAHGEDLRVFDRPLAVSQTVAVGTLLRLNTSDGYWAESTVQHVDAADWAADTVTAVGKVVRPTTKNGHWYKATARSGDFKTHATTEPTWPTDGSTVTDDAVTWTDMGVHDVLTDNFGVALEAATSAADTHPIIPVAQAGAVRRAALAGLPPTTKPEGSVLGLLILC